MECKSVLELLWCWGPTCGGWASARPPHLGGERPTGGGNSHSEAIISLLKVKWTVRGTIPAIKNNYVDHVAPWKSANCAPSEKS